MCISANTLVMLVVYHVIRQPSCLYLQRTNSYLHIHLDSPLPRCRSPTRYLVVRKFFSSELHRLRSCSLCRSRGVFRISYRSPNENKNIIFNKNIPYRERSHYPTDIVNILDRLLSSCVILWLSCEQQFRGLVERQLHSIAGFRSTCGEMRRSIPLDRCCDSNA